MGRLQPVTPIKERERERWTQIDHDTTVVSWIIIVYTDIEMIRFYYDIMYIYVYICMIGIQLKHIPCLNARVRA